MNQLDKYYLPSIGSSCSDRQRFSGTKMSVALSLEKAVKKVTMCKSWFMQYVIHIAMQSKVTVIALMTSSSLISMTQRHTKIWRYRKTKFPMCARLFNSELNQENLGKLRPAQIFGISASNSMLRSLGQILPGHQCSANLEVV